QPAQERIDLMDGEDADRGAVRCTRFRLPVAVSIRPQTQRKAEANASGDGFLGRLTELPRAPARILAQIEIFRDRVVGRVRRATVHGDIVHATDAEYTDVRAQLVTSDEIPVAALEQQAVRIDRPLRLLTSADAAIPEADALAREQRIRQRSQTTHQLARTGRFHEDDLAARAEQVRI